MQFLFNALGALPLPWLHRLGTLVGGLVFLTSSRERRRASDNLAQAFPQGIPAGLAWQSALSSGRSFLELPFLWTRSLNEVLTRVAAVDGWEHVDAAKARGEAVIFLTPHIGCFELSGQFCASRLPIVCLYRAPRSAAFERVMVGGRTRSGMGLAAADNAGVKKLLKSLKRGEAVGILPDQVPQHGEGLWAPHFGKPAYTMTLAARLSELPNTATMFIYTMRLPGGRFRVIVRPPQSPIEGNLEQRVHAINREVEKIVMACPDQYFWSYNRYKSPHAAAGAARQAGEA